MQYYEEYAPYMVEAPEEQPNTADCVSFPTLPSAPSDTKKKVVSVNTAWQGSEHGVIGVNVRAVPCIDQ